MPTIQKLLYNTLILPDTFQKVLLPGEIPMHHKVFAADFPYTQEFAEMVKKFVPQSVQEDIKAIKEKLGISLDIIVDEKGIKYPRYEGDELPFGSVNVRANPSRRCVDVSYFSSNIAMYNERGYAVDGAISPSYSLLYEYTSEGERLVRREGESLVKQYSIPRKKGEKRPDLLVTWYQHNVGDAPLTWQLYFRNYAIMFNNLAVDMLNKRVFTSA